MYEFELNISAANGADAQKKAGALADLAKKLSTKELVALANVVQNDPVKTAMAKKYLNL